MNTLKEIFELAYQLILPAECRLCSRRVWHAPLCNLCLPQKPERGSRCPKCYTTTNDNRLCQACRLYNSPLHLSRYLWSYNDVACQLVKCMKYSPSPALCKIAGSLLADSLDELEIYPEDYDLLIPIPSSAGNLYKRGFNQCYILAQCISKKLKCDVAQGGLIHIKDIPSQASLSHQKRFLNIRNAFYADSATVSGKRILLIDDVVTTGATTYTAAALLLKAGAKSVSLISLLRSDNWTGYRDKVQHILKENYCSTRNLT